MNQIENFTKGIFKENPILFSVLGLCPALAITTKLQNAIGMGIAFIFVLTLSNIAISLIRKIVPNELRIPTFIVIIATFVTIVEMLLNAYMPAISRNLGIYLSLIVVNCIILGRAEAFASKNNLLSSAIDGLGMGIGYTFVLCIISVIREVLPIFSSFFITSAGAYLILGLIFAFLNKITNKNNRRMTNDNI